MVEVADQSYNKAEFIETASGNKVSRSCQLCGSQNIVLNGKTILKPRCTIRGDLANVRIGKYCIIEQGVILRPAYKKFSKGAAFCPQHLGDHVFIDEHACVFAAQIGSFVHIGKNAIVGKRCILRECCRISDDAVLPADTVVPPFAIMAGSPAKIVGELPYCTQELMTDATISLYASFKPNTSA